MGGRTLSPGHRTEPVREVVNRWRVDDDWWRVPISRTYYIMATPTALLEVYRDDRAGDWYLQRVIDYFPRWRFRVEVSVRAHKEGLPG